MTIRTYRDITPTIGERVYIDATALVVGDVTISDDVSVWPMAVVRGDVHSISIGARSNIQDGSILHVTHDGPYTPGGRALVLGEDVTIGHRAVLHACAIGDRCLVGMGAIVMDDAVLEDEVMLGGGSLVTPGKRLETRCLYQGSPVRKVRPLKEREIELLAYSAAHYVQVKDSYLTAD